MYKLSAPQWQSFEGMRRLLLSWQFSIWSSSCLSWTLGEVTFLPLLAQRDLNRHCCWDRADISLLTNLGQVRLATSFCSSWPNQQGLKCSFHTTSVGLNAWILPVKLFYKRSGFLHLLLLVLLTFLQMRDSGNVLLNNSLWKNEERTCRLHIIYSAFLFWLVLCSEELKLRFLRCVEGIWCQSGIWCQRY